jgi:hypothetical protein
MKTRDSMVPDLWGRSAATRAVAAQNMRMALVTEGEGPTSARYRPARTQAAGLARLLPNRGPRIRAARAANTPTCWPDRANMWAQPASLKELTRVESSSSRTPRNKASSRGPASPPAVPRPVSMPARSLARPASSCEGLRSNWISRGSTNTLARTAGRKSAGGRHRTRITAPLGGAVPRIKTVARPVALPRAWSAPWIPRMASSMYDRPPEARRASEITSPSIPIRGIREELGPYCWQNPPPPAEASASALK